MKNVQNITFQTLYILTMEKRPSACCWSELWRGKNGRRLTGIVAILNSRRIQISINCFRNWRENAGPGENQEQTRRLELTLTSPKTFYLVWIAEDSDFVYPLLGSSHSLDARWRYSAFNIISTNDNALGFFFRRGRGVRRGIVMKKGCDC